MSQAGGNSSSGGGGGGGTVTGTGTDKHLVRWDGTGVPVIQDGVAIQTDTGEVLVGPGQPSNPSQSFVDDPAAGWWIGGADDLHLVSAGTGIVDTNSAGWTTNVPNLFNSALACKQTSITADYTVLPSDSVIYVDTTSGPVTITLDTFSYRFSGSFVFIYDTAGTAGTNNITVTATVGNISGSPTYVIDNNYGGLVLAGNILLGFWQIIAEIVAGSAPSSGQPLQNLGITWDGGSPATITITSADATALSGSNLGWVSMPSNTLDFRIGLVKNYTFDANQSFTDSNAGDIAGMLFGVQPTLWNDPAPFFIYAVSKSDDSDAVFMISRIPGRAKSPGASSIGKAGAIVNTGEHDFFCMANVTVSDYASSSCTCIGSFTMSFDGTDSWYYNISGLGYDFGIGSYGENTTYNFPQGQNGANTGLHFSTTGTFPDTSQKLATYTLDRFGNVTYIVNYSDFESNGVGTDEILSVTPLKTQDCFSSVGIFRVTSAVPWNFLGITQNASNNIGELPISGLNHNLQCGDLTLGDVSGILQYTLRYKIYYP